MRTGDTTDADAAAFYGACRNEPLRKDYPWLGVGTLKRKKKGPQYTRPLKASLAPLWNRDSRGLGRFNLDFAFVLNSGGRLGQGYFEHTLIELGLNLVGVDIGGHTERPLKATEAAFT